MAEVTHRPYIPPPNAAPLAAPTRPVVVRDGTAEGLFLSTYGYTANAIESLSQIERRKLRFGDEEKIVGLCRTYVKTRSGIWSPPTKLSDVLVEGTE